MNYDLIKAVEKITKGEGYTQGLGKEMLGDLRVTVDGCFGGGC